MEKLSLKTKKQLVISRVIYDYIVNGLADALQNLSEEEVQLFVMRINMQAITHAIELSSQEKIADLNFCFDQLGVSFETGVPLSQVEFSQTFIDSHIEIIRAELGKEFDAVVEYLEKMETEVI